MLENTFKTGLVKELKSRFPGCIVLHADPNEIQGIPDLVVLYEDTWAALEGKKSARASHRPNQDYYVEKMNEMSYAAFIYPENKEEILNELERSFQARRSARLAETYTSYQAKENGTRLHAFAAECIALGQKLPKSKKTLNAYVNDAIGFRMTPEQVLYYSGNCFGTADSITFKNNLLRIHDLKTGAVPAHMEQLFIYDALFCLEYRVHPQDIQIENRIYQNDDIFTVNPTEAEIKPIMDKIIEFDKIITELKLGEAV